MIELLRLSAMTAAAFLLTYLVYSTITLASAWWLCRSGRIRSALTRLRAWKLAMLLPFPLAVVAIVSPAPWLPVLPVASPVEGFFGAASSPTVSHHSARSAPGGGLVDGRVVGVDRSMDPSATIAEGTRGDGIGAVAGQAKRTSDSPGWSSEIALVGVLGWLAVGCFGLARVMFDLCQLRRLIRSSRPLRGRRLREELRRLQQLAGVTRPVLVLESTRVKSPLAAGLRSPSILVPGVWFAELSAGCRKAVLSHELVHVARRDAAWNLLLEVIRRVFFFQPLNGSAVRHLRRETEYVADHFAARMIDDPADLAWSLVQLAERFKHGGAAGQGTPALAAGMSALAGGLHNRVAAILNDERQPIETFSPLKVTGITLVLCCVLLAAVPRFGRPVSSFSNDSGEFPHMRSLISRMGLITGFVATAAMASPADEPTGKPTGDAAEQAVSKGLPDGLQNFSGMLIGKMVDRDIERGRFTVNVDYVARVWQNNKASRPRSAVGKEVTVNGVTGKWLDQLLLVRPGESVEFEAQHRGGDELTFPGEWLKKVPAFDASEHPVPPDGFRGFAGLVTGQVVKKIQSSREIHLRIDSIQKTFEKDRSRAAEEVVGKKIVLAGFWARMSEPFEGLEKGDTIRAGVLHRVPQSDHFTVVETAEKTAKAKAAEETTVSSDGFPTGMRGFRGILRGKLVSKDVEKGTLVVQAQRVTRTWKANRAEDTESCRGRSFLVKGITGKWLDVMITLDPGDAIEVEAFHNGGQHLDFVSEWLKKVD